jgi:hypothetical protein
MTRALVPARALMAAWAPVVAQAVMAVQAPVAARAPVAAQAPGAALAPVVSELGFWCRYSSLGHQRCRGRGGRRGGLR